MLGKISMADSTRNRPWILDFRDTGYFRSTRSLISLLYHLNTWPVGLCFYTEDIQRYTIRMIGHDGVNEHRKMEQEILDKEDR